MGGGGGAGGVVEGDVGGGGGWGIGVLGRRRGRRRLGGGGTKRSENKSQVFIKRCGLVRRLESNRDHGPGDSFRQAIHTVGDTT